jgi:hypothetical protein
MQEINPEIQREWEKKLEKAGLPEEPKPLKIPVEPTSGREILTALVPGIEKSLEEFKALPNKIQDDILEDLKKQRKLGMPPKEILDRFDILIVKGRELDKMTEKDSDRVYIPKLPEIEEGRSIDDAIAERVDELIQRIEDLRKRNNSGNREKKEYKN